MRDETLTGLDETAFADDQPQSQSIVPRELSGIIAATAPALALAACGGGGSAPPSAAAPPAPPAPPVVVPPTGVQGSRFLAQSTMGATKTEITAVSTSGYDAWLTTQFALSRETKFYDWMLAKGFGDIKFKDGTDGFNPAVWRQVITGQDQLRQRVGVSLLDFLVVSVDALMATSFQGFAAAAYLDILWDGAFGNYRELIEKVSTNNAMAIYLTFLNNRKADTRKGSVPDENYARELMQLFTLGLYKLNPDGTQQTANGKPIETYTSEDVTGLARVFTGFQYDPVFNHQSPEGHQKPMVQNAGTHETGVKTFLGVTIPAGTAGFESLKIALDTIFAHPNLPPFVSKQLIQRLVTSNPSPAYVGRVSAVFANNGSGVRGDLRAVIRAILLDTEARSEAGLTNPSFGKLREPVVRLTNWARAFGVTSPSDAWGFGDTSSPAFKLAQGIGHSPSVFNFFRPGYAPPNTSIASSGLVAPEFQITNEPSVIGYINYIQRLIQSGEGDTKANYAELLTKAADAQALIEETNLVLAAGQLSSTTLATIKTAVEAISPTTTSGPANRVYTAILLTMAAPDYIAQK